MKLLAFIKQNKIIVLALLIVLLSFGLLALPGQFAHYGIDYISGNKIHYVYNMSGYQWIFNLEVKPDIKIGKVVPHGIAIIALLALCVPGLLFSKKSSFVSLITSLALIVVAIMLFAISSYAPKFYDFPKLDKGTHMSWVPYVIAGLTLLAGGLMGYRTFKVMRSEVARPTQQKGPSYSYLKK